MGEQRSLILFPAFEIGKQEEGGVRSWGEGHEWNQTNGKRENLPLDWSRGRRERRLWPSSCRLAPCSHCHVSISDNLLGILRK